MKNIIVKLNRVSKIFSNPVLLYHSTFDIVPESIDSNIHNVNKKNLYRQINWIRKNFDIVHLEDLLNKRNISGKACITFDDAYISIFEEILPKLSEQKIPVTVFICGKTFTGSVLWRDKIRYLIRNNLVKQFLKYLYDNISKKYNIDIKKFYKATKNNKINSKIIDEIIDKYFSDKNIDINSNSLYLNNTDDLINSPYIKYGNHTFNHYVLSSLTEREQRKEITDNKNFLNNLNINQSDIFSVPFGGSKDYNTNTLKILNEIGYEHIVLSRDNLNFFRYSSQNNIKIVERFIAPSTYIKFHKYYLEIFIKKIIKKYTINKIRKIFYESSECS